MENHESKIIPLLIAIFICALAYADGPSAPGTGGLGSPGYNDPAVPRWQDLRVSLFTTIANQSKPPSDVKIIGSGTSQGIFGRSFADNTEQEVYGSTQLPHGFAKTALHPHMHWMPDGTDTGSVSWGLEYVIQNVGGTMSQTSTTIYANQDGQGTAYKHQLVEFNNTIDLSTIKDSAVIIFRLFRNVASDSYSGGAIGTDLDFHYETNVLGSIGEYGDN